MYAHIEENMIYLKTYLNRIRYIGLYVFFGYLLIGSPARATDLGAASRDTWAEEEGGGAPGPTGHGFGPCQTQPLFS